MKLLNIIFLGVLITATACKKDEKATYIEGVGSTANTSSQAKNSATSMLLPAGSTQPAASPVQVTQNGTAQPANISAGSGLNPEHGKPGHRCDIPVGAPLNSAPAAAGKAQTTTASGSQQITLNPSDLKPATTPAASQKTAPGMNPPHGQPGHRCDIAVGAPLNSPAGKTTPAPAAPQTVTTTSSALPSTVAAPAASSAPAVDANGKALAVNPAHGQPGHRCDIAVGAPLK